MPLIYYHSRFLDHDTGQHPENAVRLKTAAHYFDVHWLWENQRVDSWPAATLDQVAAVHTRDYLTALHELAERGGGRPDPDTIVSPQSYDVTLLASGAAVDATRRVLADEAQHALCLVRPPGHHALPDRAMGFCLTNHIAVAARWAIDQHGLDRVLVVDWDVHHGNGTQAMFYRDSQVGYFSAHRWPFYPGTGAAEETGAGDGLGTTRNLPMKFGISRDRYLAEFTRELGDFADRIRPQLVLISAGFDAHRLDPIGSLGLETEDFESLTAAVLDVAAAHAEGRVVSLLEGGYNPPILAECLATHVAALREREE